MATAANPTRSKQATQARGRARRELLIQSAKDLLDEQPLDSISLADVAARADIPTGSAYHFFPSVQGVFQALAERFAEELDAAISAPYEISADANWSAILFQAIDRACVIYEQAPGYRQLIIGGKAPPAIKLADRIHDEQIGPLVIDAIGQYFVMPEIPRAPEIFFNMVEMVDLFLMLSVIRNNAITEEMKAEAKRAAYAYLRTYLPDEFPRRAVTNN